MNTTVTTGAAMRIFWVRGEDGVLRATWKRP